jgi:hypothetical protein
MIYISHDEDDGIDNADGTGFVAVSGPELGCVLCREDQPTRWTTEGYYYAVVGDCGDVLAVEDIEGWRK